MCTSARLEHGALMGNNDSIKNMSDFIDASSVFLWFIYDQLFCFSFFFHPFLIRTVDDVSAFDKAVAYIIRGLESRITNRIDGDEWTCIGHRATKRQNLRKRRDILGRSATRLHCVWFVNKIEYATNVLRHFVLTNRINRNCFRYDSSMFWCGFSLRRFYLWLNIHFMLFSLVEIN